MRVFFLLRFVPRLLRALSRGEPWAIWTVAGLSILAGLIALVQFARKPLGGDPEAPPIPESAFRDESNPYRDF